jgi:hypothetical protein
VPLYGFKFNIGPWEFMALNILNCIHEIDSFLFKEYFSNVRENFCKRLLNLFERRVDLFMQIMYAVD